MAERAVNPFVEQFRRGGVARELRLMAAQGALPLKPADLAELLHLLLGDPDPAIGQSASSTLIAMPVEDLLPISGDRDTPPALLGWVLSAREEPEVRAAALQNPSTPDEAVEGITGFLDEDLAELVVINQVRLLRRTTLLEALEQNARLNKDQQRRLRELRESFRIGQAGAPAPPPPAPPAPPPPAAGSEPSGEALAEPAAELASLSADEAVIHILSEDERQDQQKVSVVQELYRLNTAQKVITALKGTREQRAVLVRDPNRMVATAVLGSPRLTDAEVESFAGMRNVSDEILRQIGTHKDWTKKYSVIANLVKNPRTPIGVSLSMVARLTPRDIKGLATDRNVPEVIRKQAQKFVKEKHDPKAKS